MTIQMTKRPVGHLLTSFLADAGPAPPRAQDVSHSSAARASR
jgi:hypothetical protein